MGCTEQFALMEASYVTPRLLQALSGLESSGLTSRREKKLAMTCMSLEGYKLELVRKPDSASCVGGSMIISSMDYRIMFYGVRRRISLGMCMHTSFFDEGAARSSGSPSWKA